MKYKIDTTTWKRREHYEFFNGMDDPFWGTVVPVDFTECYLEAKKSRTSFFLCSLHRILTAANRIEAFRYRIENGEVVCYDRIHVSPTIGREDGSFGYGFFEYFSDLHEFIRAAERETERVKAADGLCLGAGAGRTDLIYFGCSLVRLYGNETCPVGQSRRLHTPHLHRETDPVRRSAYDARIARRTPRIHRRTAGRRIFRTAGKPRMKSGSGIRFLF